MVRPARALTANRVPSAASGSLTDRVLDWRDRLVSSPRFQRAAGRFPPTRWIARRRAKALFDLVAGFTYSQVLLACVRLDLFDWLLEQPRTLGDAILHTGLDEDAANRLLAAAVSLGLVEHRRHRRFGLGPLGAPMARSRAIAAMVEHHAVLYVDLADPVALLRGLPPTAAASTRLSEVWGYAANPEPGRLADDRIAGYSALMSASQSLVADQILDAYPLARHRRLVDVGGGEGGFAITVARRHPHLQVTVFDLPAVAARAAERLQREGLQRVSAVGGDFTRDALPAGADVVTLVRVVHDHDDAQAQRLLQAVHASLADGGVVLVGEPMSGTAGAEASGDAYFGMYLLAMGSGRPRTPEELIAMLGRAGFRRMRLLPTSLPLQTRLIAAFK